MKEAGSPFRRGGARGAGRGDPGTRAVAGSLRRVVAGAPQGGGPRWGSR
jgi:hypothetical protein